MRKEKVNSTHGQTHIRKMNRPSFIRGANPTSHTLPTKKMWKLLRLLRAKFFRPRNSRRHSEDTLFESPLPESPFGKQQVRIFDEPHEYITIEGGAGATGIDGCTKTDVLLPEEDPRPLQTMGMKATILPRRNPREERENEYVLSILRSSYSLLRSHSMWEKALAIALKNPKLTAEEKDQLQADARINSTTVLDVLKEAGAMKLKKEDARWRFRTDGETIVLRERFDQVVDTFSKYSSVVSAAIQHNPEVTSLVWSGVLFFMQVGYTESTQLSSGGSEEHWLRYMESAVHEQQGAGKEYHCSDGKNRRLYASSAFYSEIYEEGLSSLSTTDTPDILASWNAQLEEALPQYYAAVLVFVVKARSYFASTSAACQWTCTHSARRIDH